MAKSKKDKELEEEKLEDSETEEKIEEEEDDEQEAGSPEEITPGAVQNGTSPLATRAAIGSKAHAMKEKLAAQSKVRVFIPLAAGEKQGVTQSVILNGYPIYIRKGTYVEVPQSVAEVLETKLKHKMSVENHPSRINGDEPVQMTKYGN